MSKVESVNSKGKMLSRKPRPLLLDLVIRLVKEKPLGAIGGVIVLAMLIIGLSAPLIAPYPPNEVHADDRLTSPSSQYVFGTDNFGRDLLTRVIYGARISMTVGLVAPIIEIAIAIVVGVVTGFIGGKLDLFVQRLVDAWLCFPNLLILLSIMSLTGPGLLQVIMVLGLTGGIQISRTVRSAVIGIKQNLYVEGALAIGCPTSRVLLRHILPNIMPVVIILFTMRMATAILAEASLSFLGYGVPPPNPTWGGMLSGDGRKFMLAAPWMALWPGLALSIAVFGISVLGDAVRDILDPRLRGGLGRYGKVVRVKKSLAKSVDEQ